MFDVQFAMAVANQALALAGRDGDRPELEALNAVLEHRTENGRPPDATDLQLAARAEELLGNPELRAGADHPRGPRTRSLTRSPVPTRETTNDVGLDVADML